MMLIPLGVFAASSFEILTMWATRQRSFNSIAAAQVSQSLFGEALKIGLGFAGVSTIGLITGHIFGHGAGAVSYLFKTGPKLRSACHGVSVKLIKLLAWRFRGFPITRAPGQVILAMATQAPLYLVAANFSVSVAGQMGVAMMAFMAPFALVGQAAGRAYFAEISRLGPGQPHLILDELRKVTRMLALLSAPVAIILFFFSELVASLILGEEWAQAGRFVSMLSLALVPQFISATIIRTLDVIEAHALVIGLHITRLVVVVGAFIAATGFGASPEQAVLTFSLVLGAHYVIQNALVRSALGQAKMVKP